MKKLNFRLFLIISLVLFSVSSFLFQSSGQVLAQSGTVEAEIIMNTSGYLPMQLNSYNLRGYYVIDNFPLRRFTGITVYFEYEKAPSNNASFSFPSSYQIL